MTNASFCARVSCFTTYSRASAFPKTGTLPGTPSVAAGDAHRVWFPEMVEHLRLRWRDDLSIEALLGLRDELDDMLGRIRSTRHISNPLFKCPTCGHIVRGTDPRVSVRATIFALVRFGVAAREPARALEMAWSAYRSTAGLDPYGQAAASEPARLPECAHAGER
jgi:hypothetical protein